MIPRAAVCAERIGEVLDTESSRRRRRPTPVTDATAHGELELRGVEFRYPGAEAPVLRDITLPAPARADDRDHRQHRRRQDHAARPDPAAVRRHRRARCWSTASTCATSSPRRCGARIGLVPQKPYLFTGTVATQPALRQPGRHRRGAVGRRSRSPRRATSSRRCPTGSTRRSPRAAPTSPAASGSGWRSPGRWSRKPEIYLFDDSFSALDLATDARLRAALRPRHRATRR